MNRVDVPMPVVTEEGEDGVVTAWFVDEGASCSEGQMLAEVQAEKVASEVHAPVDGFVVDRVGINDPVPQGAPICAVVDQMTATEPQAAASPTPQAMRAPVKASPAAKRLARELGVDMSTLTGTGPGGRVTEADVRSASNEPPAGEDAGGLRRVIARNLRRSRDATVPVTLFTTVDLGSELPDRMTARVVAAAAAALSAHSTLNGRREGDDFTPFSVVNVSLAVQTDEGLVAPVIHDAGTKSLDELASTISDLADRARAKQLTAADYDGGTFSVSNLGNYGIDGFTPVINLPEVAILGVGRAKRVPVVDRSGSVTTTHEMVLSLTFDHAFVDGAPAAEFLADVGTSLAGD